MKFKKINESFICENCGQVNKPAQKTCRNHCVNCLYSKHLDENLPGDRLASCGWIMKPVGIDYSSKKWSMIIQKCLICGKIHRNKLLDDDNLQEFLKINQF